MVFSYFRHGLLGINFSKLYLVGISKFNNDGVTELS